ncbi:MAG: HIT family protein [Myxococcota bacterium]|nr:HIT family protein [Myxococcota bacterium]MDW8361927.1 HIT family protein [Myxococcales bacterium]
MATLFTRIIRGELPGRFVWKDDRAVVFLTIAPLRPGHVLVVPRAEVDHWLDADPDLLAHLIRVAQTVGKAIQRAYRPTRVGLAIVGLEVPHLHIHVSPIDSASDLDFRRANHGARPEELDEAAAKLRAALREMGCPEVADA